MEQILNPGVDREVFERVWRRVMPEDRADCPFTLQQAERPQPPAPPAALPAMAAAPKAADPAEAWGGMFGSTSTENWRPGGAARPWPAGSPARAGGPWRQPPPGSCAMQSA